jgi:hypothetical protein
MIIEFYQKKLYGKTYLYPSNHSAETICKLINRPTLTKEHLRICKEAGWEIKENTLKDFKELFVL